MKNPHENQQIPALTREQAQDARRAAMTRSAPVQIDASARILPKSWNSETRTVDLVLATDTPVTRQDSYGDIWQEILACDSGSMRQLRPNSGRMSLTIDHADYDAKNSIGLIVENSLRFEPVDGQNAVVVTARINDLIEGDVEYNRPIINFERGNLPNTSCRYVVYGWTIEQRQGDPDKCTAIDWEPLSLSPVVTPADPNAYARSFGQLAEKPQQLQQVSSRSLEEPQMTIAQNPVAVPAEKTFHFHEVVCARAASLKSQGISTDDLLTACAGATSDLELANKIIDFQTARSLAGNGGVELARHGQITVGDGTREKSLEALRAGIALRAARQAGEKLDEFTDADFKIELAQIRKNGKELMQLDLVDQLRCVLIENGDVGAARANRHELARLFIGVKEGAYQLRGAITAGDLSNLTANLATKTLVAPLQEQFFNFMQFVVNKPTKDYKLQYPTTFDGITNLPLMAEGQKYQQVTLADSAESYRVFKRGLMLVITDALIAGDDLGALREAPAKMMQSAMRTRVKAFFDFLAATNTLSDGNALFSAAHSNIVTPYVKPDTSDHIDAARIILNLQAGPQGEKLALRGWRAIIDPNDYSNAMRATGRAAFVAATAAQAVPPDVGIIEPVSDPYLNALNTWYLFANPAIMPAVIFATLESAPQSGMMMKSRVNFENDCFEITLADSFGFGPAGSRGLGVVRVA